MNKVQPFWLTNMFQNMVGKFGSPSVPFLILYLTAKDKVVPERNCPYREEAVYCNCQNCTFAIVNIIIIMAMVKLIIQCDSRDQLDYKLKLVQQFN